MKPINILIFGAIIIALVGFGVWWMSQQPGYLPSTVEEQTPDQALYDDGALDTQEGTDATIDAESDRIEDELGVTSETDFSTSGLSGQQLGL